MILIYKWLLLNKIIPGNHNYIYKSFILDKSIENRTAVLKCLESDMNISYISEHLYKKM